jgi:hypothetical protein
MSMIILSISGLTRFGGYFIIIGRKRKYRLNNLSANYDF